jgi:hypothetical protein
VEVDRAGFPHEVNPDAVDQRALAVAVQRMTFRPT